MTGVAQQGLFADAGDGDVVSPHRIAEAVDALRLQHGELDALALLCRLGWSECAPPLRRWPRDVAAALTALRHAQHYAAQQGLQPTVPSPRPAGWPVALSPAERELSERCRTTMRRPAVAAQFDLFGDNAGVAAEADTRRALMAGDAKAARTALRGCRDARSADALTRLIDAIERPASDIGARCVELQTTVTTTARQQLGAAAEAYLAQRWSELATISDTLPLDATRALPHASLAWLHAGQPARACECIERDPLWPQHPQLLIVYGRAAARLGRTGPSRQAWMQLCWQHPAQAEAALDDGSGDAALDQHWRDFQSAELAFATTDFPAWMLIADRRHVGFLPRPMTSDEAAATAYDALLALIRSGGAIEARRALQQCQPALLTLYLAAAVIAA